MIDYIKHVNYNSGNYACKCDPLWVALAIAGIIALAYVLGIFIKEGLNFLKEDRRNRRETELAREKFEEEVEARRARDG